MRNPPERFAAKLSRSDPDTCMSVRIKKRLNDDYASVPEIHDYQLTITDNERYLESPQ